jgi:hypothetical protein
MSRREYLLRRTAFAFAALVAVLTATFAVIELTANPTVARVAAGAARQAAAENANATEQTRQVEAAIRQYRAANGLDRPLPVRYVDWMWSVFTLDWGTSRIPGRSGLRSVRSLVADGAVTTALWVGPAVVCSLLASTVAGSGRLGRDVPALRAPELLARAGRVPPGRRLGGAGVVAHRRWPSVLRTGRGGVGGRHEPVRRPEPVRPLGDERATPS